MMVSESNPAKRVREVEAAVLSKQFALAKPDEVVEALVTLVTLGRARQRGDHFCP